jgi:hypothetical protein
MKAPQFWCFETRLAEGSRDMANFNQLTKEEREAIQSIQDKINQTESEQDRRKLITQLTLILEKSRLRIKSENKKEQS